MPKYHGKYLRASHRPLLWIGIGGSILALVCACIIVKFLYGAMKASNTRHQTIEAYVISPSSEPEPTVPPQTQSEPTPGPEEETQETTNPLIIPTQPPRFPAIDFDGLRGKNGDVVAWLQIPALEMINYPVVLGRDNAYYTTHAWDGEESENGAIFLDFRNQGDFSQMHNILYGHCMKDGSMFQSLGKWEGTSFYNTSDKTVLLYLPEETRVYKIFAVERVNALDNRVYRTDYTPDKIWEEVLSETLRKSQHNAAPELTSQSEVLTLSTCVGDMDRLVVHSVCVEHVPL